jgi:hypothetical protein
MTRGRKSIVVLGVKVAKGCQGCFDTQIQDCEELHFEMNVMYNSERKHCTKTAVATICEERYNNLAVWVQRAETLACRGREMGTQEKLLPGAYERSCAI